MSYFRLGNVEMSQRFAKEYEYLLISLPRKIGRIISADFGSAAISASRVDESMINASFRPVLIP